MSDKKINIFKAFWIELKDRCFSSKMRIIKTIGTIFVPFIYAFICIAAFWNPFDKIGTLPIAIVNQDKQALILESHSDITKSYAPVGVSLDPSITSIDDPGLFAISDDVVNQNTWEQFCDSVPDSSNCYLYVLDSSGQNLVKTDTTQHLPDYDFQIRTSVVDEFLTYWHDPSQEHPDLWYNAAKGAYCAKINEKNTLTNITYYSNTASSDISSGNPDNYATYNESTKEWSIKKSKYYSEIGFPPSLSFLVGAAITDPLNTSFYLNQLSGQLEYFATYQNNFFAGEIMDSISPFILSQLFTNILPSPITYNIDAFINKDIQGENFGIYGIGIGQLFVCVGLWVGCFSMTITLDRKKRVKNITAKKWYITKGMVMASINVFQSVFLMLAIGVIGWFALGSAFFFEILFIMFCALIFIIIIQAIWFSFRDKAFASIIIVIFLILNLAAGGGTFPAILQNDFFHAISYILPFTYVIHGQSAIIYGIGTGTNAIENCLYVLKMCGVMLIFAAVFLTLGLCTCGYRLKEINYGTANKYKLAKVLMSLNNKKYNEFIETNRRGKKYANFKKLPNEQNKEIYEKTMELYPLEVKFKRFRKDDFVEMDSAILE